MFTISIGKADTQCPDKVTLTSGMVKAVQVAFTFSEDWENFNKIAVFCNGTISIDVPLDREDKCYIPHEILAVAGNEVTAGVYGCKGEGDDYVAIPTVKCSLGKVVEGVNPSGDESAEPTPTVMDDIVIRVGNIEQGELGVNTQVYGKNNIVGGVNNSVGTKGYRITGYAGIVGETGDYVIDGTEEDALAIQSLIDNGEKLYWTIINNMSCDYFGEITQAWYSRVCQVRVSNFYTNKKPESADGVQIYQTDSVPYSNTGYPYTYAPELGYSIRNSTDENFPHIIINDHPELGTHDLTGRAVSFGVGNISQGEQSFTQGGGNRTYGAYASAHGQDNQVGFDTHALGRLNYAPSAQDSFIAGFANTIRGFVNSGVTVVGAHNIASRDGQFVAGIMNNNKKKNLFEIGGGKFPNIHHNAFEVDEDGIVYSNEQPLPFQKIINKTLSPSIDILGGNYTSLIGKDLIGNSVSFSPSKYFAHLRIDCTKIPLTVGSRYCMVVGFTLSANSGSDISQLELKNSTYDSTNGVKHRSIDFQGAKIGKNYLVYPFAHEDWYEEIGLYGYMPSTGFSGSIRYDSVSLYPMDEIAPDYPDYSFSVDDIGIIHRTIEKVSGQNVVKYHSVIQINPLEKEYVLTDVARMITGGFQGLYAICPNTTSSVNISVYSGNEATNLLFTKLNS